jgi:hypothetical protein
LRPAGNASEKLTLLSVDTFGLVIVNVTVDALTVLAATADGENALAIVGDAYTISPALVLIPGTAVWVEVGPVGELICPPSGLLVLLLAVTVIVQEAPAAKLGMVALMVVPLTVNTGENVGDTQVPPVTVLVKKVLTKVSLKVTLVNAVAPFRLVTVNVLVVLAPT